MVLINYSNKELSIKIVYYGAGLSGKTTNLYYIYKKTQKGFRGELVSLDTDTERTLFFDLLPMEVGKIMDLTTKIQLYTVPGQVHYDSTRKLVLKGVDGIVFVVDSQAPLLEANIESFKNMEENLAIYGRTIKDIPIVFQYNKRDLKNVLPLETLNKKLNPYGFKYFESIAVEGKGVFETLREITKLTLDSVKNIIVERGKKSIIGEEVEELKKKGKKEIKEEKKKEEDNIEEEKIEKLEEELQENETMEVIKNVKEGREEDKGQEIEKNETIEEIEEIEDIEIEEISDNEAEIEDKKKSKGNKKEGKEEVKTEKKEEDINKEKKKGFEKEIIKHEEIKTTFKNIIEKNLKFSINKKLLEESSYLWLQFSTPEGVVVKKWKISKEKIKDGAILNLNIELNIK